MDEANFLNDIANCKLIDTYLLELCLSWNDACLILNEIKGIDHVVDRNFAVDANCEHCNDSTLQAVGEHEGGARLLLHIKGNRLEAAHMKEGFVLDCSKARMMQKLAVHEVPKFMLLEWLLFLEFLVLVVFWVLYHFYPIFATSSVNFALHEDVEKETD